MPTGGKGYKLEKTPKLTNKKCMHNKAGIPDHRLRDYDNMHIKEIDNFVNRRTNRKSGARIEYISNCQMENLSPQ